MTSKLDLYRRLVKAQDEYLKATIAEAQETMTLAYIHGWRSTRVDLGRRLRAKIEALKAKIEEA